MKNEQGFLKKILMPLNFKGNFLLNALAGISIFIAFVYTVLLGRIYGVSREADIYFASLKLILYGGYFSQIFYECFVVFYADLKIKSDSEADTLYSTLICQTSLISLIIILIIINASSFIAKFYLISPSSVNLIRLMSAYILLQNFYNINKNKLNINFKFKISYLIDVGLNVSNVALILFIQNRYGVFSIAYALIISTLAAVVLQFIYIFKFLHTKFTFSIWHKDTKEILKGSLKIKIGAILYSFYEVFIPTILMSAGVGVYAAFSYAMKFAVAVNSVINAPNITVFSNEVNFLVSGNKIPEIFCKIKGLLKRLVTLFLGGCIAVYLIMPVILKIVMNVDEQNIRMIKTNFILLCIFYLLVTLDAPFMSTILALKKYNINLLVNSAFFVLFVIEINIMPRNAIFVMIALCSCQLINFLLYLKFMVKELRNRQKILTEC